MASAFSGPNRKSATATTVRLAMPDGALGTLATEDYLEYDVELPGNGTLERDRITVGKSIAGGVADDLHLRTQPRYPRAC